jgi:single-strand DNA-binding protein
MSNIFCSILTLGRDSEVKYLPSGTALLTFTAANNIGYGDKQQTLWFKVNLWGKRAEGKLSEFLLKGTQVFVSGELSVNEYMGKDGTNKYQLEINANIIDLIGNKPPQTEQQEKTQTNTDSKQSKQKVENNEKNYPFDDDITF